MQLPQPKGGVSLITGRAPGKRARAGAAGRGRKVAELRQAGALQHRRQRRPARPRGRGGRGRGVAFGGGLRLPYLFDRKKKPRLPHVNTLKAGKPTMLSGRLFQQSFAITLCGWRVNPPGNSPSGFCQPSPDENGHRVVIV